MAEAVGTMWIVFFREEGWRSVTGWLYAIIVILSLQVQLIDCYNLPDFSTSVFSPLYHIADKKTCKLVRKDI